jgi:cation:H+ antiporter
LSETVLYPIALIASIVIIWKAGDAFVDSACAISYRLGVPRVIIGLTIVSFATTSPEFVTSVWSSLLGNVELAYGNAVGSCIVNVGLILGLAAIIASISVEKERIFEGGAMLGMAGLVTILAWEGLGQIGGAILFSVMIVFQILVVRRESKRRVKNEGLSVSLRNPVLLFIFGALGVVAGSRLLVYSGVGISSSLGIPEAVIGFTLVAFGTSIPELTTAIISSLKKVPEISLGNIIGANILNLSWVLGAAAMINPISKVEGLLLSNLTMFAIMVALLIFMFARRKLHRLEGAGLLGIYLAYLVGLALI